MIYSVAIDISYFNHLLNRLLFNVLKNIVLVYNCLCFLNEYLLELFLFYMYITGKYDILIQMLLTLVLNWYKSIDLNGITPDSSVHLFINSTPYPSNRGQIE